MTRILSGDEVAARLLGEFPDLAVEREHEAVLVDASMIVEVSRFLHADHDLDLAALIHLTAVDYVDYFEIVYRITSYRRNHGALLKTRAYDRVEPVVPSVTTIWSSATFQEREVFDLMGVRFDGHPELKRIVLWEGFDGHPLRKDFLLQRP